MANWKIILRKAEPAGTLEIEVDTCEAPTQEDARKIFEERHGVGRVVSGPMKQPS
jgi:hypothetical protein